MEDWKLYCTWVFITVSMVCMSNQITELRGRVERNEDDIMGINQPITYQIKEALDGVRK